MLTVLAYLMIIAFMIVIMKKWLSPFITLVLVPIVFAVVAILTGLAQYAKGDDGVVVKNLGTMIMNGMSGVAGTGIMLIFAILYFSIMLDAGLFDPITKRMIYFAKGDPMKILVATAIVAAAVSMNGDGTTTTLIVVSAFLPIYKKLDMKIMNLGVLLILQNTIMNLLPWGGPTARVMAVMKVDAKILTYLLPGMILALVYVIAFVAVRMGRQERKRLGISTLTYQEIDAMLEIKDEATLKLRRPKFFAFNGVLTIVLIVWLVTSSFVEAVAVPPSVLFLIGTVIALMVNYPNLKEQSSRIAEHGGDALQVVILIFAAGVLLGLFSGTGMASALSANLVSIIPASWGKAYGLIIAFLSAPGTFFLSNDGFYFGVMASLGKVGASFGFTNMQLAVASLMGQAFHLLSPLVAFIYLLLRLTGLDMGAWQRESAKYALGVFAIFILTGLMFFAVPGHMLFG
ncbi:MAG: citrate:proton symporter [Streptococcaceae bacterium]|jgi:CitMHS family citrate-Mg2+:H+ or citrate-Ca2+:H+ symporter|nr:citrate:proton symporter [Streptococcaceae bacterium]